MNTKLFNTDKITFVECDTSGAAGTEAGQASVLIVQPTGEAKRLEAGRGVGGECGRDNYWRFLA